MGDVRENDDPLSIFKNLDGDLEEYLSPEEVITNFQKNTNFNEFIGQIISMEGPTSRKNKRTGKLVDVLNMHVKIQNEKNLSVQDKTEKSQETKDNQVAVAIWGEEIARLKPSLKNGHVVLFEGVYVVQADKNKFNHERPISVTCSYKTQVYDLTILNTRIEDRNSLKLYTVVQDALDENGEKQLVCLQVYLKIGFALKSGKLIGNLSDDRVNMETWVMSNEVPKVISEGQYLKVYGKFVECNNRIHFAVNDFDDMQVLDIPNASIGQLYKGLESPKKKRRIAM